MTISYTASLGIVEHYTTFGPTLVPHSRRFFSSQHDNIINEPVATLDRIAQGISFGTRHWLRG
jgi:hypothetical protein